MTQDGVRIRRLGISDYDALLDLWRRSGLHSLRPQGRDSREALARQFANNTVLALGIDVDSLLVGAVVATHDGRKGWINRLAVDPHHRAKGHASRLVAAAEDWLSSQDIHIVACLIEGGNTASLALFTKAGYSEPPTEIHYLTKRASPDI